MRVLFKAVQDTSVKKVIDNIKGEVNSLGGTMDAVNKKMGGNILGIGGGSSAFKKLNPQLFQNVGQQAAKDFTTGFKQIGMADLPKIFSKTGPALPKIPDWMSGSFFTKEKSKQKENKQELKSQQDRLKFYKDLSLLTLPLFKPTSVFGNAFAAKAVSQGLLGTQAGRNAMAKHGLSGSEGAIKATAILMGGAISAGLALQALTKTLTVLTIPAFEKASKLYAKSLTSGLSIGFNAQRQAQAQILGVSEIEVIRFGKALEWINPKIANSVKILRDTAIPLATTHALFEVLKIKISALGATIAMKLKPSLDSIIRSAEAFVDLMTDNEDALNTISAIFTTMVKSAQAIAIVITGVEAAIQVIADNITLLLMTFQNVMVDVIEKIKALLNKTGNAAGNVAGGIIGAISPTAGAIVKGVLQGAGNQSSALISSAQQETGLNTKINIGDEAEKMWDKLAKTSDSLNKQWDELLGKTKKKDKADLPAPQSYMKRLGASALEHMGLIMGGGGGNPAKETAKHTKQMVTILNQIHRSMSHGATSTFDPAQSYR